MVTEITQNELVLMAYNELPPEREIEILHVLENNKDLELKLDQIRTQMSNLDLLKFQPNPTSVQIVLEESCSSSSMEMI